MTRWITRRQALGEMLAGTAVIAAGCGTANQLRPDPDGSTLHTTYQDAQGTGVLTPVRGEPLRPRTELGRQARAVGASRDDRASSPTPTYSMPSPPHASRSSIASARHSSRPSARRKR